MWPDDSDLKVLDLQKITPEESLFLETSLFVGRLQSCTEKEKKNERDTGLIKVNRNFRNPDVEKGEREKEIPKLKSSKILPFNGFLKKG